jgi:hypothetical protein
MNGPKYIVIMPDELCSWADAVRGCDTWQEAMTLRQQGGIVYEQSPRGTPTSDLLRASIDKVKLEAAIAEVAAKGGA